MFLSSRGLKNVVCDDSAFVFNVNGREFVVSKFKAQFISPAVSQSLWLDPTQSSFEIDVPDAIEIFESILSICDGGAVSEDCPRAFGFGAVCRALGNDELISLAMGTDGVSISNVALRLSISITDSDVGFACEHFGSLDHSSLPANILEMLLADKRLKIESEDSLLRIITNRISTDDSLIGLLDYIECKYLSDEAMSTFVSLISMEWMTSSVWSSVCRRLQLPVSLSDPNPRDCGWFALHPNRPFDGVFAHLWRQCGQNPHIAGLIEISVNDDYPKRPFKCYDILSEGKWWASNVSSVEHYVKIDLKDMRLIPSGYSVKAHRTPWDGSCFVRSWRFEGSNDDSNWEVLDNQRNSDALMGNDKEASFVISSTTTFRFLRFIMSGLNSSGYPFLALQRLEIFGILRSPASETLK
jgi:hypothetical protein